MRRSLTSMLCLLALASCSETTDVPLSPESTGLELANGVQQTLLSDLSYSGTEVGGGPTFSFDLPAGLAGVFHEVVTPAAGVQPCWFKFVAGVEPQWIQGAGLIRELPVQGRLLGLGTIEVLVTGTRTEGGQTAVVEGTLVIKLAEHVVEPKQGSPYFNSCGTECVRFSLQAFFFPVGIQEPDWIEGMLTAQEP